MKIVKFFFKNLHKIHEKHKIEESEEAKDFSDIWSNTTEQGKKEIGKELSGISKLTTRKLGTKPADN